jgi:biotin carboxylase
MQTALNELVIEGVRHTAPLQEAIMVDTAFQRGEIDIGFLERKLSGLIDMTE